MAVVPLFAASAPQAVNVLDAGSLLSAFGALGIAVVLFAETGLLVGFLLPGDSLLFTAGLLCVPGGNGPVSLSLPQVLICSVVGALVGAQVGYWIGRRGGRALLARSKSRKLHEGAARAEELLAKYGHAKAIVLARFVPIVRTVLNPLAGALGVPARVFALWQIVGGARVDLRAGPRRLRARLVRAEHRPLSAAARRAGRGGLAHPRRPGGAARPPRPYGHRGAR